MSLMKMKLIHAPLACLLCSVHLCLADDNSASILGISFMPSQLNVRTALVGCVVLMLTFFIMKRQSNKKYNLPDGPLGWPLLGNIGYFNDKYMYFGLKDLVAKYGKVFRLNFGKTPWLIIADPQILHDSFVVRGADFVGRLHNWTLDEVSSGQKDIAFSEGRVWKFHRKLAATAIRQYSSGEKLTERVRDSFEIVSATLNKENAGPVCVNDYVTSLVYNVVAGMMYGKRFEVGGEEFLKLKENQQKLLEVISDWAPADFIPILRHFPFPQQKRVINASKHNVELTLGYLERHKATFDKDNIRDFTDELILVANETDDPETKDILTDEYLVQIMSDMFSAGVDTTIQTLSWALMYVAAYPEVQEKLHQQIDDVLGREGSVSLQCKSNLPYVEAVIHEAMRIRPITPFAFPRATVCDTVIGDFKVPKGTVVVPYAWYMQNDPEIWKKPEEFNPDRFINADGNFELSSRMITEFGEGRRRCVGEPIAKNELFLLLTMLIQRYQLSFPDGCKPDFMPEPTMSVDMRPKKYNALFTPRI